MAGQQLTYSCIDSQSLDYGSLVGQLLNAFVVPC